MTVFRSVAIALATVVLASACGALEESRPTITAVPEELLLGVDDPAEAGDEAPGTTGAPADADDTSAVESEPELAVETEPDPEAAPAVAEDDGPFVPGPAPEGTEWMRLSVEGNQIVDAAGDPLRVIGVNFSGSEYACAQAWGIWDAPPTQASIDAMRSWGVNTVRIQLNEHCWLGRNGVEPAFGGDSYRRSVLEWVDLLAENDMWVIVGMSWSGPGDDLGQGGKKMPNRDHSIDFWTSAATLLADRHNVLLGLYGEVHDVGWDCWFAGCEVDGWAAVGMQELVDVVRATPAEQPLLIGGIAYANDASRFIELLPQDPLGGIVLDGHVYSFSVCNADPCLTDTFGAAAQTVPVVMGEIGENDCSGDYTAALIDWLDGWDMGYLIWSWNAWGVCPTEPGVLVDNLYVGPDLLASYDGTPNAYGARMRDLMSGAGG